MNKLWLILTSLSIITLLIFNPAAALPAMMTGTNDALKLAASLVAVYALWMGIMEILDATGLGESLAKLMRPLIKFLFPGVSEEAARYISLNFSVNMLGAGGAATPLGIKAVELMDDLSGVATANMILFAVINSTSLQILPTTVIGLRTSAGSGAPTDTILIGIASQIIACITGILLCKLINTIKLKRSNRRHECNSITPTT